MNILNKLKISRRAVFSEYAKVNANMFVKSVVQAAVILIDLFIMFVLIWNMFTYFIPNGSWINIVDGSSMDPTMHSGQIIYTEIPSEFDRGDIVTVRMNERAISQRPEYKDIILVKRIIGMPGDRLIIDEHGDVYVNGEMLTEEYLTDEAKMFTYQNGKCNSVLLGADEYFLMGDNREVSYDSRSFGIVNYDDLMYEQSDVPTTNFWLKLVLVLLVLALDIFLYSLIEFVLTECAYWVIYGRRIKKDKETSSDSAEFNNVITTSETVILKGDNK
jgi:signal peptidase I